MKHIPLAQKMRPKMLDDVIGQEHLVGKDGPIRKMVELNRITPFILTGPPGTGKTTLAEVLSNETKLPFVKMNAVSISKKDLDKVITDAEKSESSTILFIDEIHRLTRVQFDVLLTSEAGDVILIGSTTESAHHSIPPAILSRSRILNTMNLSTEDVVKGIERAIKDKVDGLGDVEVDYKVEDLEFLAKQSNGDMRASLNNLENLYITNVSENKLVLTIEMVENQTGKKYFNSEGKSSTYNYLSAFHKSIRGSDVDASLYYLGILLEMGEMESVIRRMSVIPSEDCSLVNTGLESSVFTSLEIAKQLGSDQGRFVLARAVIELALTPKSNSAYKAINEVFSDIKNGKVYNVPGHLMDNHYKGAPKSTKGYKYAHDYKDEQLGPWVNQDYLPEELTGKKYYVPNEIGHEKTFKRINDLIDQKKKD